MVMVMVSIRVMVSITVRVRTGCSVPRTEVPLWAGTFSKPIKSFVCL